MKSIQTREVRQERNGFERAKNIQCFKPPCALCIYLIRGLSVIHAIKHQRNRVTVGTSKWWGDRKSNASLVMIRVDRVGKA